MQLMLRNPQLAPITPDQLRKFAPAVFAKEAHEDVSERYGFMPTYKVLEHMHKAGFVPVEVRNYHRRDPEDFKFTKHMIRFRQAGALTARVVGDLVPQVVLLNSHDRSSPYSLFGGMFRLICSNGMLVSEGTHVIPIKLRHTVQLAETVVEVSMSIIKQHKHVFEHVNEMRKLKLNERQQLTFAKNALALRPTRAGVIDASGLLTARRTEDNGADLWHVFNRVQENLTKGGIEGKTATGRRVRTSEIQGVNGDIALNTGLWALAMDAINKASKSSKAAVKEKAHA